MELELDSALHRATCSTCSLFEEHNMTGFSIYVLCDLTLLSVLEGIFLDELFQQNLHSRPISYTAHPYMSRTVIVWGQI
jgi:hypothetical protein